MNEHVAGKVRRALVNALREADARVLRRRLNVLRRSSKVGRLETESAEDAAQWFRVALAAETRRVLSELGLAGYALFIDDTPELVIRVTDERSQTVLRYGPVGWDRSATPSQDVLRRRGVGYVLRHVDVL